MSEICPKCGLPMDIHACDELAKQSVAQIRVYTTKSRYQKLVTIVEGLKGEELGSTTKELKHKLACGGTFKDGLIVLQGNHKEKTVAYLQKMGYSKDVIKLN
ncbi:MAG TPA: stress response translation initiation inhibitor YciH [Candidatus Norongarragalinales archaeon]|nr:stress response translation initiation inhibitor YciH [Candidatus Norongarragalinales archaeon]